MRLNLPNAEKVFSFLSSLYQKTII